MSYLEYYPGIQSMVDNLSYETLNSPMVMDLKNDPQLADYQFYLDSNPELIPAILIFFYSYLNRLNDGESLNVANPITDSFVRNTIINLIKNEITSSISNTRRLAGEIRDPSNEELIELEEPGIELQVRPTEAVPEEPPIDVNLLPVSARVISNEEKPNQKNLPTARHIEVGGRTKKRRIIYNRLTNKSYKKMNLHKIMKKSKKNKNTLRRKTKTKRKIK